MPEERYQCSFLVAGGAEYCLSRGGDLGNRFDGQYRARGATKCDWGWRDRTQGAEVEYGMFDESEMCTKSICTYSDFWRCGFTQ